jgi:hypothetical protein
MTATPTDIGRPGSAPSRPEPAVGPAHAVDFALQFEPGKSMRTSKRHRLEKKERQLDWRSRKRVDPLLAQHLLEGQKPVPALVAGGAAASAGAMAWTIIALATGWNLQALALAIGALSGFAIGHFGRAADYRYGRLAALFCVLSCAAGESLVAYSLNVSVWLLYDGFDLAALGLFMLGGACTAYGCAFWWLSRDQQQALWEHKHNLKSGP